MLKIALASALACTLSLQATPLDDYVNQVDPAYQWEVVSAIEGEGFCQYNLLLCSQQWRSETEVDRPLWMHWITLVVPHAISSDQALLKIRGSSPLDPPCEANLELAQLACLTESATAELFMVPNQALCFRDEYDERYATAGRSEDQLVAYTWRQFLKTEDSTWLLRLPMTKAVVRAMDAIQEFMTHEVKGFVLVGASKRGWTAWTAAAVDQRVTGVAALVIDLLNLKESMQHHYCAYGCWSPALQDYLDAGTPDAWDSPQFEELLEIVEPFNYRDRLLMPKLIINSAGDDFFLPDSSRYYFDQLEDPKSLRYIPNTNHSLRNSNANASIATFYVSLVSSHLLPTCHWELRPGNRLSVTSDQKPTSAKLWSAHNATERDFRLSTQGALWSSTELPTQTDLEISLSQPEEGWNAQFVELTYDTPCGLPFTLTTDIFVFPDDLPFNFSVD